MKNFFDFAVKHSARSRVRKIGRRDERNPRRHLWRNLRNLRTFENWFKQGLALIK
jgi:hypothetical protein